MPASLLRANTGADKTMVVLVIAIVVPVCVVGAIIIGCSIVWWGRITQRKLVSLGSIH